MFHSKQSTPSPNASWARSPLRLAGLLALAALLAGCKWTSDQPLITDLEADNSPLKPATYSHGDTTYKVEGKKKGPVVVTTRSSTDSSDTTYSAKFDKLAGKLFLVQIVSGSDITYEIIETTKTGFVEYRPTCENTDKTIALAAGAVSTAEESACKFPDYAALRKAAVEAATTIKAGGTGFAGDTFIRQK